MTYIAPSVISICTSVVIGDFMAGEIKIGLNGKKYMVFRDEDECTDYAPEDAMFACFDGYLNAYEIED